MITFLTWASANGGGGGGGGHREGSIAVPQTQSGMVGFFFQQKKCMFQGFCVTIFGFHVDVCTFFRAKFFRFSNCVERMSCLLQGPILCRKTLSQQFLLSPKTRLWHQIFTMSC